MKNHLIQLQKYILYSCQTILQFKNSLVLTLFISSLLTSATVKSSTFEILDPPNIKINIESFDSKVEQESVKLKIVVNDSVPLGNIFENFQFNFIKDEKHITLHIHPNDYQNGANLLYLVQGITKQLEQPDVWEYLINANLGSATAKYQLFKNFFTLLINYKDMMKSYGVNESSFKSARDYYVGLFNKNL
jgi:hypothetical protein